MQSHTNKTQLIQCDLPIIRGNYRVRRESRLFFIFNSIHHLASTLFNQQNSYEIQTEADILLEH